MFASFLQHCCAIDALSLVTSWQVAVPSFQAQSCMFDSYVPWLGSHAAPGFPQKMFHRHSHRRLVPSACLLPLFSSSALMWEFSTQTAAQFPVQAVSLGEKSTQTAAQSDQFPQTVPRGLQIFELVRRVNTFTTSLGPSEIRFPTEGKLEKLEEIGHSGFCLNDLKVLRGTGCLWLFFCLKRKRKTYQCHRPGKSLLWLRLLSLCRPVESSL